LDLFVRGSDKALWHSSYFGAWSDWDYLGGILTSDPAACSWAAGRLDVFARGTNNALFHRWYDSGQGWSPNSGWESLDGSLTSGPAACSWGAGRLDVFVRSTDNALYHRWFDENWSGWESLGGGLTSDPAAVSWDSGRIDVFARGNDQALYHKWFDGKWSGWEGLGGGLNSGPAVCSWGPGRLDVFAMGLDNALWHKWFDNTWSEWESLGGTLASDPAAVSSIRGRIDVTALWPDGTLRLKSFDSGWSEWQTLDSLLGFRPPPGQKMTTKKILEEVTDYAVLQADNPSEFVFPEVGALMRPFFVQNEKHTLFVEPRVTDTTVDKWEEWVVTTPVIRLRDDDRLYLKDIPVIAQVPVDGQQFLLDPISPYARFNVTAKQDWVTNPQVAVEFDSQAIGRRGALSADVSFAEAKSALVRVQASTVNTSAAATSALSTSLSSSTSAESIRLVRGSGANAVLLQTMKRQSS
jgi:hypothetical protein